MTETTTETTKPRIRKYRGYVTIRQRLMRALREGMVIYQLGPKARDAAYRLKLDQPIYKTGLKMVEAKLDEWEAEQKTAALAPAAHTPETHIENGDDAELGAIAYLLRLPPAARKRVIAYVDARQKG